MKITVCDVSPSTVLPQDVVVFLLQPFNRWSKQTFPNTTKLHAVVMTGRAIFCFGSYFPMRLARGNTDCCDCSDCALFWWSQQGGGGWGLEKNSDLEDRKKKIFSWMQGLDKEWCFPQIFFLPHLNVMQITVCSECALRSKGPLSRLLYCW